MNDAKDSNSAILQRAYELIEKGALEEAQEILLPLLESDADNAAVWWVYSHATRDAAIGQAALERVLALDPNYPGASELKAETVGALQEREPGFGLDSIESRDETIDNMDIDDWEDLQPVVGAPATDADVELEGGLSRGQRAALLLLPLLVIVVGAALITSGSLDISDWFSELLPQAQPTVIVVVPAGEAAPTEEPDATLPATATEAAGTAERVPREADKFLTLTAIGETPMPTDRPDPTQVALFAAAETFSSLVAADASDLEIQRVEVENTEFGETMVLFICAAPGPEFNERLNLLMNAVVAVAPEIPADIKAVAAGLWNCADEAAVVRVIGTTVSVILDFVDGALDAKEFQRSWQPFS